MADVARGTTGPAELYTHAASTPHYAGYWDNYYGLGGGIFVSDSDTPNGWDFDGGTGEVTVPVDADLGSYNLEYQIDEEGSEWDTYRFVVVEGEEEPPTCEEVPATCEITVVPESLDKSDPNGFDVQLLCLSSPYPSTGNPKEWKLFIGTDDSTDPIEEDGGDAVNYTGLSYNQDYFVTVSGLDDRDCPFECEFPLNEENPIFGGEEDPSVFYSDSCNSEDETDEVADVIKYYPNLI